VSDPPVKFRRAKAMHPLAIPVETPGTDLYRLLSPFVNVRAEQWPLLATCLAAALRPTGPYPILKCLGEQGSAKSTMARACRSLLDPNAAPVRAEPRDVRDLMIAANNGWVICLDNLSTVKPDLSDALCRLSTGGGFATRTLYTDEDETIFDAMRPVILTSIEEVGTRSDLLERSLILDLPTIGKGKRRAEKKFWREFDKARPQILGALLDVVSGAMRRLPEIERRPDAELSRMADFEQWGEAAEVSLGLEPGTFAQAYAANRESATQTVLESSPLIEALLKYLQSSPTLEYTASELLGHLSAVYTDEARKPGWPKTPRVLSQILRRVAPNLRQIGVVAEQDTRGGGSQKEKVWKISAPRKPKPQPTRELAGRTGGTGRKSTDRD
jgi:putative DNA primase/helicase